jgi:hypothetical protein
LLFLCSCALLVAADTASSLFPTAFDPANPRAVSDVTVHLNDSLVVVFDAGSHATSISVALNCFATQEQAGAAAPFKSLDSAITTSFYGPCKFAFGERRSGQALSVLFL